MKVTSSIWKWLADGSGLSENTAKVGSPDAPSPATDDSEIRVLFEQLIEKMERQSESPEDQSYGSLSYHLQRARLALQERKYLDPLYIVELPRWLGEWGNTPLEDEIYGIHVEIHHEATRLCGGLQAVNAARHAHNQRRAAARQGAEHTPEEADQDEAREAGEMRLRVISDYGATERLVANKATPEVILETMSNLDWSGFHQVILERPNGDWLEVGGSLDGADGLSVMFEENGKQVVIREPPVNVDALTAFLIGYLSKTAKWKESTEWT